MHRQHPVKIVKLMSKNFWLLLIPLIRGLISLKGDFYGWVRGAWLDILILLFIVGSAYIRWLFSTYAVGESSIDYRAGIFGRMKLSIPFTSLSAVAAERFFLFRPINAVNLFVVTNSGFLNTPDLKITVARKDYDVLFKKLSKPLEGEIKTSYKPSKLNLIFFSLVFSSTLSGVIFIATFIFQSGKIIGQSLETLLLTTAADISEKLVVGLPPLAVAASLIIAAGWIFSFVTNILRYIGFRIKREGKRIFIRTGFLTKRRYYINPEKINYADIQQNLLMKIFSVMSVHVNCTGYGKAKNELPVFVPITTKEQVISSLRFLLPDLQPSPNSVKPKLAVIFRYVMLPFYFMMGIPIAAEILYHFFPFWKSMILFVTVMAEIPTIWLLIVKFVSFFTTGISENGENICINYCSGFRYHTIIIPKEKIATITLTQNKFQTFADSCNLIIYSNNEFAKSHMLISMPLKEIKELLNSAGLCKSELRFFK